MATKANLVIDQGATFSSDLALTDENGDALSLEGYTAESQMRKWYTSSTAIDFATAINLEAGTITLSLTAAQSESITPGRYVYDVKITKAGVESRVVEGIVTVTPNVTR